MTEQSEGDATDPAEPVASARNRGCRLTSGISLATLLPTALVCYAMLLTSSRFGMCLINDQGCVPYANTVAFCALFASLVVGVCAVAVPKGAAERRPWLRPLTLAVQLIALVTMICAILIQS